MRNNAAFKVLNPSDVQNRSPLQILDIMKEKTGEYPRDLAGRYRRVFDDMIANFGNQDAMDDFVGRLMIVTREEFRNGFPLEVADDISFVWQLNDRVVNLRSVNSATAS